MVKLMAIKFTTYYLDSRENYDGLKSKLQIFNSL